MSANLLKQLRTFPHLRVNVSPKQYRGLHTQICKSTVHIIPGTPGGLSASTSTRTMSSRATEEKMSVTRDGHSTLAADPYPDDMWSKRHLIFSKMDEGIILPDNFAWVEVTAEESSIRHAQRMKQAGVKVIVDGFGGVGGNAIQFAKVLDKVYSIELNPSRLAAAKNNARVYGVENKIEFIEGSFLEVAPTLRADAVFLDPPWSVDMKEYLDTFNNFHLATMKPIDGITVYKVARSVSRNICYFLPPTVPQHELRKLADEGDTVEFVNEPSQFSPGLVAAISAFYGNLIRNY